MNKGGAEATSTSAETRRAGPKSTSIASRVGLRLGGGGSRCTDLDRQASEAEAEIHLHFLSINSHIEGL